MSHPATMKKLMEEFVFIWLMLHNKGTQKCLVLTVDSDVVVIVISMFEHLGLQEQWIDIGTGKAHQHIPVHTIVQSLAPCTVSFLHRV